jgi:hypothetical protein
LIFIDIYGLFCYNNQNDSFSLFKDSRRCALNGFSGLPRIRFDMHLCVESLFCGSGKGFLRCVLNPKQTEVNLFAK